MTTINRAWTVSAQQDVAYRVETTYDILDPANPTLVEGEPGSRRLIVTDTTVNDLYGEKIRAYAAANRIRVVEAPALTQLLRGAGLPDL